MDLTLVAEDLMTYAPLPSSGNRLQTSEACLSFQPGPYPFFANVSRVRTDAARVGRVVAEAQQWFRRHGRDDFMWFLGPSSTPSNIRELLHEHGAVFESEDTALVLEEEPPLAPRMEIRQVVSKTDLLAFRTLMLIDSVQDASPQVRAAVEAGLDQAWEDLQAYGGRRMNFLAYIDDQAQAAGSLLIGDHKLGILAGGATRAASRGQGCYRALVNARWHAARQVGCTALAVQASAMSAPILRRSGFQQVAALTVLRQPT